MLKVEKVTKSFGSIQALRGISLEARDGEITGLIGPNGAGKTTLLRIIYTVLKPDGGRSLVDGHDSVREKRTVQARLGVLPDVRGLYPRLTAREHIRYFGRLHGMRGDALEHEIDGLVDRLGMREFCDRPAKGYSRGQQMKVALARSLVHRPHNVLLDEPTNGLDVATSRAVRELAREIASEGRCVLFSSHVMSEVVALCDRIAIIARGEIVMLGTQDELRRRTGLDDMEEVFLAATAARPHGADVGPSSVVEAAAGE